MMLKCRKQQNMKAPFFDGNDCAYHKDGFRYIKSTANCEESMLSIFMCIHYYAKNPIPLIFVMKSAHIFHQNHH